MLSLATKILVAGDYRQTDQQRRSKSAEQWLQEILSLKWAAFSFAWIDHILDYAVTRLSINHS
jgi:hypothetical protein